MTVLMISYDLNGQEKPSAYEAMEGVIKSNAISFARPLYSQWFVETLDSVNAWDARVRHVADDNDRWFINVVTQPLQGYLDDDVNKWLNARV